MQERIYINGVLMEQSDNKGISLVYQSQLFTDIDSIVSNRTNSVDFPMTRNNLLAIDRTHLPGIDSPYAYRRHRVIYIRDGIQIFTGYGTLLSITDTAIKFSFTWGNVEAFKKLLDIKLRDLTGEDSHVIWREDITGEYYDHSIDCGPRYTSHPIMPVKKIIDAMQKAGGVTIKNAEIFDKYVIPLVTKECDEDAKMYNGVNIVYGSSYQYQPKVDIGSSVLNFNYRFCCLVPSGNDEDTDITGMYKGNGIYDVSDISELKFHIGVNGWSFSTLHKIGTLDRKSIRPDFTVYAVDESGNNPKMLGKISVKEYDRNDTTIYYRVSSESWLTINVQDISYIVICVNASSCVEPAQFANIAFLSENYNIQMFDTADQEVLPGGLFPLWKNLPDWDCAQLLKNLMKIEGVFPFPGEAANEIEFIGTDRLYDNRPEALDWTGKLVFNNGLPTEQTMQYGSYARVNHCKYAEDETLNRSYDGTFEVDSETLDSETDLINLDFAATDTGKDGKSPVIPMYSFNDEQEVEFTEVTPRILQYYTDKDGNQKTTFQGLDWPTLLSERYYTYRQIVNRPRVIKASVVLDTLELSKLDLSVPVYSFSLGHYYAITKLTTKDNGLAEVELLMLGTRRQTTIVNSVSDLAILTDDGENYYASIPSMSKEEINALRQDQNYKICLIRYGYTRRGKLVSYTDKTGKETNTNTDRHKFRNYRRRERWRIIGEELLVTGKIASHSQTRRYYGSSSLVFALNDTITLPPMRSKTRGGKSRNLTKSGRIKNSDRDGIAELSIAMYKRDDKGRWERISNICPVRGRSEDKRKLWEFSSDNFVEVE